MDDQVWFAGRRALVTGGASGMGRAVVTQLLRRGCRVLSVDRADQDDGPTPWFHPVRLDLADGRALQTWLDSLDLSDDPIDVVCNAAGVSPLDQTSEVVMAVDFLAVRRICRHLLPGMRPGGAVVNVASVAALTELAVGVEDTMLEAPDDEVLRQAATAVPHPGLAYVVAKRAVVRLSLRLAAEHARRQVRVNCTSPHFAATPMHYAIKRRAPEMYGDMPAPMGRWSSAEEQADAIVFLLGPRATYVTGQNLVVDGGWEAVEAVRSGRA